MSTRNFFLLSSVTNRRPKYDKPTRFNYLHYKPHLSPFHSHKSLIFAGKMDPNPTEITHDFPPFFRVHNTGLVERYEQHDFVPPSRHPQTDVVSRDITISPENQVSARIYLPKTTDQKLPLLIYIHGGAFSIQSAFSSLYHGYLNSLASHSRSVVVSIDYRLAPEHPIPACYDDSYLVLKWIHSRSDPWLNDHVDFERVYVAGDSAGANIGHDIIIRANHELGFKFSGLVMIHPFFGNDKPDKLWNYICPDKTGLNEFRLNPTTDLDQLSKLGCDRILVCVAENDFLKNRGLNYYEGLKRSEWKGDVELFQTPGVHVFHLFDPDCEPAVSLMKRIVSFLNYGQHVGMSHF